MQFKRYVTQLLYENNTPQAYKVVELKLIKVPSRTVQNKVSIVNSNIMTNAIFRYHCSVARRLNIRDVFEYAEDMSTISYYNDDKTIALLDGAVANTVQFIVSPQSEYYNDIEDIVNNNKFKQIIIDNSFAFLTITNLMKAITASAAVVKLNKQVSSTDDSLFGKSFMDELT